MKIFARQIRLSTGHPSSRVTQEDAFELVAKLKDATNSFGLSCACNMVDDGSESICSG